MLQKYETNDPHQKYKIDAHQADEYLNYNQDKSCLISNNSENYLNTILTISEKYLYEVFNDAELEEFFEKIQYIKLLDNNRDIVKEFSKQYINFTKEIYQKSYTRVDRHLTDFIKQKNKSIKIIWGDSYNV